MEHKSKFSCHYKLNLLTQQDVTVFKEESQMFEHCLLILPPSSAEEAQKSAACYHHFMWCILENKMMIIYIRRTSFPSMR